MTSAKGKKARRKAKVVSNPLRYLPDFESAAKAEVLHQNDQQTQKSGDDGDRQAAYLVEHVTGGLYHGDSLGCPICNRDRRLKQIVDIVQAIYGQVPKNWKRLIHSVTVIPSSLKVGADDLELLQERVEPASAALSKRLRRATGLEGVVAVIGFDLSWNEDSEGRWDPHWQGHFHCVIAGAEKAAVTEALRSLNKPTDTVHHPVEVHTLRKVRCLPKIVSYTIKNRPYRRASWVNDEGKSKSKAYGLKPVQLRQALRFLHKLGPARQLRLVGLKRPHGKLSK